jgi:hypothetical protein
VDTSCLLAVALSEPQGRETAESLARFDRLVASNLLEAELRSALARERVQVDCAPLLSGISWVLPDRPLTPEFREALGLGRVRGADLWHLSCALFLKRTLAGLSFLTLDRKQRERADALGFETGP